MLIRHLMHPVLSWIIFLCLAAVAYLFYRSPSTKAKQPNRRHVTPSSFNEDLRVLLTETGSEDENKKATSRKKGSIIPRKEDTVSLSKSIAGKS